MSETPPNPIVAAIATPPGAGGIAIVRASGSGALELLPRLIRTPLPEPGTFRHVRVHDPLTGEVLDDAILLTFRRGGYTGEDAFELQTHGGSLAPRRVLEAILHAGAQPAPPGEFTRRAFLNGRMDLTQCAAVADLIASRSLRAARDARARLDGLLGRQIQALYATLADLLADLEHTLDFTEEELPDSLLPDLAARLEGLLPPLQKLLDHAREGHLVRDGALCVLCGRPNAGKSTLFNALLGRNRAIVADLPGTTRDLIEEHLLLEGIPLRLVDTAGLREAPEDAPGAIEAQGIRLARDAIARADLVLYLVDGSLPPAPDLPSELARLPRDRTLVVRTKADLPDRTGEALPPGTLSLSLVGADPDLAPLKARLKALLDLPQSQTDTPLVDLRQAEELRTARAAIGQARPLLEASDTLLLAAIHLRRAAEALGRILGIDTGPEILERVFSRFCVGK